MNLFELKTMSPEDKRKIMRRAETDISEYMQTAREIALDVKENGDALLHLKSKIKNPDIADSIRYTVQNQNGAHIAELIEKILQRKVSGVGLHLEERV